MSGLSDRVQPAMWLPTLVVVVGLVTAAWQGIGSADAVYLLLAAFCGLLSAVVLAVTQTVPPRTASTSEVSHD
jgi:drug/metabolite transporter (DMT)-like permease